MPENTPLPPKLLGRLRDKVRLTRHSLAKERQYIHRAKQYILRHPIKHEANRGGRRFKGMKSVRTSISGVVLKQLKELLDDDQ